jgi:hypothetical protein
MSLTFQIEEQKRRWKQKEKSPLSLVDNELEAAYEFIANYRKSTHHNASISLANMPYWLYHGRPTHMAFHDLTARLAPAKNLRALLGLNLKFIPNPKNNVTWEEFE